MGTYFTTFSVFTVITLCPFIGSTKLKTRDDPKAGKLVSLDHKMRVGRTLLDVGKVDKGFRTFQPGN